MKRVMQWILGIIVLGLLAFWGFGIYVFESKGTDVAYQTSDGTWADNEVLFNGRNFEGIVFGYELYTIACKAPDVQLQRITEKPNFLTVSWWFDDFDAPKWKVPKADHHPNLAGKFYYRPKEKEHCSNQPVSKEHLAHARKKATEYINGL